MQIWKKSILFYLGGMGYTALELLWRGRSHGSMFVLGGLCFLAVGGLRQKHPKLSPSGQALLGAGLITVLELLTGLLVNRDYSVWDYRRLPMDFLGQICPNYSLLWIPVSLAAGILYSTLENHLTSIL